MRLAGSRAGSLGLLLTLVVSAACASGGTMEYIFYPPPPDTARFQFLKGISSLDDVKGSGRSVFAAIVGEERRASPIRIVRPYGVTADSGTIYVCDVNLPGVSIIDLTEQSMRQVISPTLPRPSACAVDRETGELYIADPQRQEVVILGTDGIYAGVVSDSLRGPGGVDVTEDRVWVTDIGTKQVRVYDKATRRHLRAFPAADLESDDPARIQWPMSVHVHGDRVYVADQFAANVKVYSADGEYVRTIGRRGVSFGTFDLPKGIAVDPAGRVYVADFQFHHVQVFDDEGTVLTYFGGGGPGRPGYLGGPIGVAIDAVNLDYFRDYVHPDFDLKFLIYVTNQIGAQKLSVYGFVEPKGGR
jgi:DNA-binding beta-propeller fold protein YncE